MTRSAKLTSLATLGLLVMVVLACNLTSKDSVGIPDDKKDYIGDWQGRIPNGTMKLSISKDGTVNYERKEGTAANNGNSGASNEKSRSISGGKISKWDGNNFEVKVLLVSTTFKVEKPPFRDGARWRMVVDGVEVSRRADTSTASSDELSIDVAEMRKDDGSGKMSEDATTTYTQQDRHIHSYFNWDNGKAGTRIRFVYIAVDAGGVKERQLNESKLVVENEFQNEAYSSLKLNRRLPKGKYKVDIYINDKVERSLPFEVV
jgi:hypothetical protein